MTGLRPFSERCIRIAKWRDLTPPFGARYANGDVGRGGGGEIKCTFYRRNPGRK